MTRIGLGRDLHRLVEGRRFILGGHVIPAERGELGHSDGDVLAHAVTDAVLGATALGDIGELFPPSDNTWKDADSMALLSQAWEKVSAQGWRLVNLDCSITCERPRIIPHRDAIRERLARVLGADTESIFVKGNTNEGCDALGRGEAVEALVVCLLERD